MIKFECGMCGKVLQKKQKHNCCDRASYSDIPWREVRICRARNCKNTIPAELNEYVCCLHKAGEK